MRRRIVVERFRRMWASTGVVHLLAFEPTNPADRCFFCAKIADRVGQHVTVDVDADAGSHRVQLFGRHGAQRFERVGAAARRERVPFFRIASLVAEANCAPLSPIARWNSPWRAGVACTVFTLHDPADSPKMVTRRRIAAELGDASSAPTSAPYVIENGVARRMVRRFGGQLRMRQKLNTPSRYPSSRRPRLFAPALRRRRSESTKRCGSRHRRIHTITGRFAPGAAAVHTFRQRQSRPSGRGHWYGEPAA